MSFADLKTQIQNYHKMRAVAHKHLLWYEFEIWNSEAKRELAAAFCLWQRAGAPLI